MAKHAIAVILITLMFATVGVAALVADSDATAIYGREPVASAAVSEQLEGKVAGVDIVQTGEPGSDMKIRIRGQTSLNGASEPLYVIDGVRGTAEDFRNINPSDIVSMEVLKDASSTAIYGAQAGNGVVLVTTKNAAAAPAEANTDMVSIAMLGCAMALFVAIGAVALYRRN